MESFVQYINRTLFHISHTPVTGISVFLIVVVAILSASLGSLFGKPIASTFHRMLGTNQPPGPIGAQRFGTFGGVFTPSILTILGVVMYLRLGWVVGNVGLGGALLIVIVSHTITVATGLSVSSIATNRRVGAGGAYFIISRSLGAPAGAAIGIPLFFGQALSVTFYIVGFTESLMQLFPETPQRLVSSAICIMLALISLKSADLAIKVQYVVMAAIVLSLVSFLSGRADHPPQTIAWWNNQGASVAHVFAVFFPAVTGIMTGVGMSGDLADPRRSLPKGTMYSILVGFIVYMLFPVWLAFNANSETLSNNREVVWSISRFPSLIYVGVWGATLSSALGSLLTAPRTLQALSVDGLAPRFLGSGSGPRNEPRVGLAATFLLAQMAIFLGNLDAIAPILTMFFLATYGMTNLACGLEKWAASPSFRPDFAVSASISLLGALACFYVMSIINMLAMISALVICASIYVLAQRRVLGTTYGDARHGIWAALVRSALFRLRRTEFHPSNWRPNLIIMGGDPEKRPQLLELGSSIVQDRGIVTYFLLVQGDVFDKIEERASLQKTIEGEISEKYPNVFTRVDVVPDKYPGVVTVAQSYGVGSFEANTVMLGWLTKNANQTSYVRMIRQLVHLERSLLIVRYNKEKKFGARRRIQIWWGGLQRNGGLMLLVAFLLTAHHRWRGARVEVMTIVDTNTARQSAEQRIAQILGDARVEATARVLLRDGRSISSIIREESKMTDLAVLGFALPEEHSADAFFQRMDKILEGMPTTILVHSARTFRGEPVLFQDSSPTDEIPRKPSPAKPPPPTTSSSPNNPRPNSTS